MVNQWKYTRLTGNKGESGDVATLTVSSTKTYYQQSTSASSIPTNWLESPPTATPGYYMWSKIVTTYSNGTTSTGYAVSKNGTNGTNGTNGVSPWIVKCGEPAISVACGTDKKTTSATTVTVNFSAWQGTTRKAATGSYSSAPTGVTVSVTNATASADGTFNITIASGSTLGGTSTAYDTRTFTLSVSANSVTYNFTVTITKSVQGAQGVGVNSITAQYAIGTDSAVKTSFTTAVQNPTLDNPVIYSRNVLNLSNGTQKTTSAVKLNIRGEPGAVGGFVSNGILYLTL